MLFLLAILLEWMMSNIITLKGNYYNQQLIEENGIHTLTIFTHICVVIWSYKHISTDGAQVYYTGYILLNPPDLNNFCTCYHLLVLFIG